MITIDQIRAARGLLNWKQGRLAKAAKLSLRALNNLERAATTPRQETLKALQAVLEAERVEFLPGNGVRLRTERLEVLHIEGDKAVPELLKDIVNELRQSGGDVLFNGVDERDFSNVEDSIMDLYFAGCFENKIMERLLILEGDWFCVNHPSRYRWINKKLFGKVSYIIYGDNIAYLFWKPYTRLVIIRNPSIASTFREQFEVHWGMAIPVPGVNKIPPLPQNRPWSTAQSKKSRGMLPKKK